MAKYTGVTLGGMSRGIENLAQTLMARKMQQEEQARQDKLDELRRAIEEKKARALKEEADRKAREAEIFQSTVYSKLMGQAAPEALAIPPPVQLPSQPEPLTVRQPLSGPKPSNFQLRTPTTSVEDLTNLSRMNLTKPDPMLEILATLMRTPGAPAEMTNLGVQRLLNPAAPAAPKRPKDSFNQFSSGNPHANYAKRGYDTMDNETLDKLHTLAAGWEQDRINAASKTTGTPGGANALPSGEDMFKAWQAAVPADKREETPFRQWTYSQYGQPGLNVVTPWITKNPLLFGMGPSTSATGANVYADLAQKYSSEVLNRADLWIRNAPKTTTTKADGKSVTPPELGSIRNAIINALKRKKGTKYDPNDMDWQVIMALEDRYDLDPRNPPMTDEDWVKLAFPVQLVGPPTPPKK